MKKENKKKVVTLSAMAALLAVVLGMGGKTYAKYFTESNVPAQTATVAKWGFVINVGNKDLFGENYDASGAIVADGNASAVIVSGRTDTKVIAPGAKGSLTVTVGGSAEVNTIVTLNPGASTWTEVQLTDSKGTVDTADDFVYNPMNWTSTGSYKVGTAAEVSLAATGAENIYTKLNAFADPVSNGIFVKAGETFTLTLNLSWDWEFEVDATTNIYDTYFGAKANDDAYAATNISFDSLSSAIALTVQATQTQRTA